MYLWNYYFEISESIRRIYDGICSPIPPSEFLAWRILSGEIVYEHEFAILRAMDAEYSTKMNEELQSYQARDAAKRQAEIEAAKSRR